MVPSRATAMSRRVGPLVGGIVAVGVLALFMSGIEPGSGPIPIFVLMLVVPLVAATATVGRRGSMVAERAWAAPAPTETSAATPSGTGVPPAGSVARALGRVEARELATSPWFGVGVGFCILILALFGIWAEEDSQTWTETIQLVPWFAHPLVGMCVVAGHRAVTRSRRDLAEELFDSCPTEPTTRTLGFLWSAALPLIILTVFLAVTLAAIAVRGSNVHGSVHADSLADFLAAVVLGAGGIALGVALGRWIRFALAPVVAVVAVGFATAGLNRHGGSDWNPLIHLATAPTVEGPSPVFFERPAFWHLLWVSGLAVAMCVVAVSRHRRDRSVAVLGVVATIVVLAAGIGATRPMPGESAARIADLVANPERNQECAEAGGRVEVCVYPLHRHLLDPVTSRVEPVVDALPPEVAPPTVRQVFDGDRDDLPPEVRRLVAESDLVRPEDEISLGFGDELNVVWEDAGFDLALVAVGLPSAPDGQHRPIVVAGQARGVLAIWLATRGLDADDSADASTSPEPNSPDAFQRGSPQLVEMCSTPAVVWSAQDLAAARAVIALPEAKVSEVIEAGWARWTDPGTGTDELLAELGLPEVGPFDQVEPRPGQPC